MIKRINKLKKFGIFENYAADTSLADFNKYNLFYGWNGSGKSTLSNLFRWIETKQPICFADAEWEVQTEIGAINQANVKDNALNIKVFNKDFVKKNVFTENGVKGIVYLSEKAGKDKTALDSEIAQLKENEKQQKKVDVELNGDKNNKKSKGLLELNDNFLKTSAQKIKSEFVVIDVHDKWLLNYDKRKLADFITENQTAIQSGKSKLSVAEIKQLSKSTKPQEKNSINPDEIKKFDTSLFETIFKRVNTLLSTSITAKTIERLKENPIIANWVYQGLKDVHVENATTCEFCGQTLPKDRITDLNKHFSEEFEQLKTALAKGLVWFDENKLEFNFPHKSSLYEEFQQPFETAVNDFNELIKELNTILDAWRKSIEQKQNNPFEIPENGITQVSSELIEEFQTGFNNIMSIIDQHNKKFEGLDKKVAEDKKTLELHYVSEEVRTYDFLIKKTREEELRKELDVLNETINKRKNKIAELKKELSDELLGEEEFNRMLHKFLGRNDLSLETRHEGGYLIMRNKTHKADDNLSEGEQTAIGLVYFIAKLKEEDNKIENTIVVIDDPISSFDSNHLFHANFYIKEECENANQLFVFTHNFRFFSMQKEWISTKRTKDPITNKNIDIFRLYLIKPKIENDSRQGYFENADNVLTHFDSEYHMLFSEVKKFSQTPKNDYISSHTISNTCRQLLESFLSFKFGRKKLEKCFDEIVGFNDLSKVRKFVNHYSHKVDNGESIKGFNDNIYGEADKIVPLVLDLICFVDKTHYDSMIDRLNNV